MKHIHMDEFAKLGSPIHKMDPRAKALSFFVFIFAAVTLVSPVLLAIAVSFWVLMLAVSRVPVRHVLVRLLWILPFAGFLVILFPFITPGKEAWVLQLAGFNLAATQEGLQKALTLLLRVLSSVLALIVLMSTTRFNDLMRAMADLRAPVIILQMVEFTIRYIFVTIDELKRMKRARRSRGFVLGKNIWHFHTFRTLAQMVGTMFIRAYERGDRVYVAMLSRGFTGKINTRARFAATPSDFVKAGFIVILAIVLLVIDKGGIMT